MAVHWGIPASVLELIAFVHACASVSERPIPSGFSLRRLYDD